MYQNMALTVILLASFVFLTDAKTITTGECNTNKQADEVCMAQNAKEQSRLIAGENAFLNWLIALPAETVQSLSRSRENISVMNHDKLIIRGTNVTDYLTNWKNWKAEIQPIPEDYLLNISVSVTHVTLGDGIDLHLEIKDDNLVYKTEPIHIHVSNSRNPPVIPTPNTTSSNTPEITISPPVKTVPCICDSEGKQNLIPFLTMGFFLTLSVIINIIAFRKNIWKLITRFISLLLSLLQGNQAVTCRTQNTAQVSYSRPTSTSQSNNIYSEEAAGEPCVEDLHVDQTERVDPQEQPPATSTTSAEISPNSPIEAEEICVVDLPLDQTERVDPQEQLLATSTTTAEINSNSPTEAGTLSAPTDDRMEYMYKFGEPEIQFLIPIENQDSPEQGSVIDEIVQDRIETSHHPKPSMF